MEVTLEHSTALACAKSTSKVEARHRTSCIIAPLFKNIDTTGTPIAPLAHLGRPRVYPGQKERRTETGRGKVYIDQVKVPLPNSQKEYQAGNDDKMKPWRQPQFTFTTALAPWVHGTKARREKKKQLITTWTLPTTSPNSNPNPYPASHLRHRPHETAACMLTRLPTRHCIVQYASVAR